MTIKIVQRIAERFIKDPSPGVLVIRGKHRCRKDTDTTKHE